MHVSHTFQGSGGHFTKVWVPGGESVAVIISGIDGLSSRLLAAKSDGYPSIPSISRQ